MTSLMEDIYYRFRKTTIKGTTSAKKILLKLPADEIITILDSDKKTVLAIEKRSTIFEDETR